MTAKALSLILAAILAAPLMAAQPVGGGIRVDGAWARRAAMISGGPVGGNSAVYAVLVNPGKESDTLIAAGSDAAKTVEIHESFREEGMMMMRPVEKLDVPAGGKVEMKPGGYHIMLLNLRRDLRAGDKIGVTFQFARAGKIAVAATIK